MDMNDWNALDILYEAIHRLYHNKCDLTYIQGEVEQAYQQIQRADEIKKRHERTHNQRRHHENNQLKSLL